MRPGWSRAPPKLEPVDELRRQADIAVRVLTVFRGAALLLDEVHSVRNSEAQPIKSNHKAIDVSMLHRSRVRETTLCLYMLLFLTRLCSCSGPPC